MDTIDDDTDHLDSICADQMITTLTSQKVQQHNNIIGGTKKNNNNAAAVCDHYHHYEASASPSFTQLLYDEDIAFDSKEINNHYSFLGHHHHEGEWSHQQRQQQANNNNTFVGSSDMVSSTPSMDMDNSSSLFTHDQQQQYPSLSLGSDLTLSAPSIFLNDDDNNNCDKGLSDTQLDMLLVSSQQSQPDQSQDELDIEAGHSIVGDDEEEEDSALIYDYSVNHQHLNSDLRQNQGSGSTKRAAIDIGEQIDNEADCHAVYVEEYGDDNEDIFQGQLGTQTQPRETIVSKIEQTIHSLIQRIVLEKSPLAFPGFISLPVRQQRPQQHQQQQSIRGRKKQRRNDTRSTIVQPAETEDTNTATTSTDTGHDHGTEQVNIVTTSNDGGASDMTTSRRQTTTTKVTTDTARSIKSFARRLKVLEIIYESVVNNVFVSKRDIYYRDVTLFETQQTVDMIVTGWSHYFNVPRSCLNVTASSKGLIYGAVYIMLKNNKTINCTADVNTDDSFCSDEQGVLIPPVNQITKVVSVADFVLVIEKEASFRQLVSSGFAGMFPNGILVTGRGYPDIATRHILKYFATQYKNLPIFAFVDYDPYGLDIYAVYKWGSRIHAFDAPNLAVPTIRHIGLSKKDRSKYHIPDEAFAPLTQRDRGKALNMILNNFSNTSKRNDSNNNRSTQSQRLYSAGQLSPSYKRFITEVSQMLHLNLKCELQALCVDNLFGMLHYLRAKISELLNQHQRRRQTAAASADRQR